MRDISRLCGVSLVFCVATLWLAPSALADAFFKTPSGNIVCQQVDSRRYVECAVLSSRRGSALPVYYIRATGRASTYTSHGDPAFEVPVLRYGRSKRLLRGAVVCTSRASGLTCRNGSGHGFFLSAAQRRRF